MKKHFILLLSILFATCSQAQTVSDTTQLPVIVPVIIWVSDTSTNSTGSFKSSAPFLKVKGL